MKRLKHGVDCVEELHDPAAQYLHDAGDFNPYEVDGTLYCGKCHYDMEIPPPAFISFKTYNHIQNLLTQEKQKLELNFIHALGLTSSNDCRNELHEGYKKALREIGEIEEEFDLVSKDPYQRHPDLEMRKFWGWEK